MAMAVEVRRDTYLRLYRRQFRVRKVRGKSEVSFHIVSQVSYPRR